MKQKNRSTDFHKMRRKAGTWPRKNRQLLVLIRISLRYVARITVSCSGGMQRLAGSE